jgi:ferredoxin
MLHELAAAPDGRPVWWVHGARNETEHAFREEVDALLSQLPEAHRLVAYSRPGPDGPRRRVADLVGRLDLAVLEQAGVPMQADFYLCGPAGFIREFSAALAARGVPPEHVATEVFGTVDAYLPGIVAAGARPAPHSPAGPPGTGPTVNFVRSNLAVSWDARFETLLDLAEECDVPVGFGCRNGTCHTCETTLLSGRVRYITDPLELPATGRVLVCSSQPHTDLALDL